jgi:hypothetical protein
LSSSKKFLSFSSAFENKINHHIEKFKIQNKKISTQKKSAIYIVKINHHIEKFKIQNKKISTQKKSINE